MWSALALTAFGALVVSLTVWLFGRASRLQGLKEAEGKAYQHDAEIAEARMERMRRVVGTGALSDDEFARLVQRVAARKRRPST
jgi:hypothetical protein